jgi:hypothetical protein
LKGMKDVKMGKGEKAHLRWIALLLGLGPARRLGVCVPSAHACLLQSSTAIDAAPPLLSCMLCADYWGRKLWKNQKTKTVDDELSLARKRFTRRDTIPTLLCTARPLDCKLQKSLMLPPAVPCTMREVPTIDIAALMGGGGEEAARRVASKVREAASELGFFYVTNHGVAKETLAEVLACTRAFYEVRLYKLNAV